MAQEDKGLIYRGLMLFSLIGVLAVVVLLILFWRPKPTEVAVQPPAEVQASEPGWQVRYNAAASLARRGSDVVPWALIREMLDENVQKRNYLEHAADGSAIYDEAAARANMITALRVLTIWHEKQKAANHSHVPPELRDIYARVDRLKESPYVELQIQATKARASFFTH